MDELTLVVPGMSCGHCAHAVRSGLTGVLGVASVVVDLDTKQVVVTGAGLVAADLVAAVDRAGYEVVPASS